MLFKSSILFLAASALVAVSASPVPETGKTPAPSNFDSFPSFTSPAALNVQKQLLEILEAKPATPAPKTKRNEAGATLDEADATLKVMKYAEFSRAAYQINSKVWNCPKCNTSPRLIGTEIDYFFNEANGPSYGFVAHNIASKEIIVAFRGSTILNDFVADAKILLTEWNGAGNGAKVHSGFKKSYLSVAQPIEGMVKSLLAAHEDFKVVFVGHSLGGAEASLAAADFVAKNSNYIGKVSLYTYGQPRTGNAAFAQWMDNQRFPKFRTTYRGDIVSQIPPRPLGYQHHGQEIFYPMSGALKFCSTTNSEDPACQNSVAVTQLNVADHGLYPGLAVQAQR